MAKVTLEFDCDENGVLFFNFIKDMHLHTPISGLTVYGLQKGDDGWKKFFSSSVSEKLEYYEKTFDQSIESILKRWVNDEHLSSASMQSRLCVGETTLTKLIKYFKLEEQFEKNKKINTSSARLAKFNKTKKVAE